MSLEQVVRWFEDLAAAELEAEVAARSNPDEQTVESTGVAVNRFFSGLAAQIYFRAAGSSPPQSEVDVRKLFQRRVVLEASEFESAEGPFFTVVTSSMFAGDREWFAMYYVKEIPPQLQVIARYHACNDCQRTGKVRNRVCGECEGRGWCWRGGKKMSVDSKVLRVLKVSQS